MLIFRIAPESAIRDLSGSGARLHGGRWNHLGIGIVYASETRALATLEYLVHLNPMAIPPRLKIASIEVPDRVRSEILEASKLPAAWRFYPAPSELAAIGTQWAVSGRSLLLRVPSAVVPGECNILVNPSHPDMRLVGIARIEDYPYDQRLLKSR
jgi:RES domain-containing protein